MSHQEALTFVVQMLGKCRKLGVCVVFVLDHAEAFAEVAERQVLLYDILDSLHQANVQAMLIAVTTSMAFPDMLEKRVRSRLDFQAIDVPLPHLALTQFPDTRRNRTEDDIGRGVSQTPGKQRVARVKLQPWQLVREMLVPEVGDSAY